MILEANSGIRRKVSGKSFFNFHENLKYQACNSASSMLTDCKTASNAIETSLWLVGAAVSRHDSLLRERENLKF